MSEPATVLPFLIRPLLGVSLLMAASCGGEEPAAEGSVVAEAAAPTVEVDLDALEGFPPLATTFPGPDGPASAELVELGRALFQSTGLSADGSVSCASCHDPDEGGDDGRALSVGPGGATSRRNAPSLWNVASYATFGWDGRAATLEGFTALHLLDDWATGFADEEALVGAAGGERSLAEIAAALGAYQRTLVRRSRWDRFLGGEPSALSDPERRGFNSFLEAGCAMCHTGPSFGGDDFQQLGMAEEWPDLEDSGRMLVTGDSSDEGMFRTAPLRGLYETAPYGHAGQYPDLGEMVRLMAQHQLGVELSPQETADIVTWLNSL